MGDRLKNYEAHETQRRFISMLPVYARIDGRSFSRFTAGFNRPYDLRITRAMVETTKYLTEQTQARIGYTQSDEISLVWLQSIHESELIFNGKIAKLTSVLAGMASAAFMAQCRHDPALDARAMTLIPHFDCRVFQLPTLEEAANTFLWRERDATKNAVSMAARTFYSTKELFGKRASEMQEMMFQKGQNFNDYPASFKRGTFVKRMMLESELTEAERRSIPEAHRPVAGAKFMRAKVVELEMPSFGTVTNRVDVIFGDAIPASL